MVFLGAWQIVDSELMQNRAGRFADQFRRFPPGDAGSGWIGERDVSVQVESINALSGGVQQQFISAIDPHQVFLHPPVIRHVCAHSDVAAQPLFAVEARSKSEQDPADGAAFVETRNLEMEASLGGEPFLELLEKRRIL